MKIIDIAICVNNKDPENLGRIRCIRYSSYTGQIERAMVYKEWDDKDLFTAIPFLPTNINFIPEIGQTVKIINYNTDKETVNVEYIAGPFTTRHDFNAQTYSSQIERTSYGIASKHGKNVTDENGNYVNKKSEGVFAKHTDYGVYGKYGSDILFTENGLQLRGGKLITKEGATTTQKSDMIYQPLMGKKNAILYLKKFHKTKEFKEEVSEIEKIASTNLNYVIEYDIAGNFNFTGSPITINYYVYKINKVYGDMYNTSNPSLRNLELIDGNYDLINTDGNPLTPTFSKTITGVTETYITIRNDLKTLHYKSLNEFNAAYPNTDLHPFYFRPTEECRIRTGLTENQITTRNTIFNGISITQECGPQTGLVFQKTSVKAPLIKVKTKKKVIKDLTGNVEQTFSALKSDKIYFLTTDQNNITEKPITFEKLDKYELTQDNYLQDIEPNTYAMVRGETLLSFLRSVYTVLTTHVHNINSPYAKAEYNPHKEMEELYQKLESDILNKSIRIN
jgi:hypothetical protein